MMMNNLKTKTVKQLALLDLCYPDYFTGYHRPVIAVPQFSHVITNGEMADLIDEELNVIWEMIEEGYTRTERLIIDEFIADLRKDSDNIYYETDMIDTCEDDYDECPYFYFAIINPIFKYGLTFLNS